MSKKPAEKSAAHKAAATRARNRKSSPQSVKGPSNEQENISIKKIDNGYLVSRSSYNQRGQYVERQVYTPSKPQIEVANAPKAKS